MSKGAWVSYENHFTEVIKLLSASKYKNDVAWRAALRKLNFPEIKYTCIGYGAGSVSGSGSGAALRESYITTAKEVVDMGIENPDLFMALAIFEEGVGPDRISDMACNIIFPDLLQFNERILRELKVKTNYFKLRLKNGNSFYAALPENPTFSKPTPVLLLPSDILRDLPIAKDWEDISEVMAKNAEFRAKINDSILRLWQSRTLREKGQLRDWALSNKQNFTTLMEMLRGANPSSYDLVGDALGEVFWRQLLHKIAEEQHFYIVKPKTLDRKGILHIVEQIITQFTFLIEDRRFSEELYHEGRPRPEKAAQRLFFAIAYSYCKSNNLDLTPEADTGNGPVDFKISNGFFGRFLVEIKLSSNRRVVEGYTKQLAAYAAGEETLDAFFVLISVGKSEDLEKRLLAIRNKFVAEHKKAPALVFVDGIRRPSASKLR